MLRRIFSSGLFAFYGLFSGWTLVFLLIEIFPGILTVIPLKGIKYYALKKEYVSDLALVFVYRQTNYVFRKTFIGDLYSTGYGLPAQPLDYLATYDRSTGFARIRHKPHTVLPSLETLISNSGKATRKLLPSLESRNRPIRFEYWPRVVWPLSIPGIT